MVHPRFGHRTKLKRSEWHLPESPGFVSLFGDLIENGVIHWYSDSDRAGRRRTVWSTSGEVIELGVCH